MWNESGFNFNDPVRTQVVSRTLSEPRGILVEPRRILVESLEQVSEHLLDQTLTEIWNYGK